MRNRSKEELVCLASDMANIIEHLDNSSFEDAVWALKEIYETQSDALNEINLNARDFKVMVELDFSLLDIVTVAFKGFDREECHKRDLFTECEKTLIDKCENAIPKRGA